MTISDYQISNVIRTYMKNMKVKVRQVDNEPDDVVRNDEVVISKEGMKRMLFERIGEQIDGKTTGNMNKNNENIRILIVDDNKDLREILEEYLKDGGDITEGADNGKEALLKHNRNPYDLVITDLNMPEMSGIELMKTIRKDTDMTEFIIITGYASIDSAVETIKIGAYDYIVKPFRMEELKVVVKNAKDKIKLKKINTQLFDKLKSFYNEIERYKQQSGDTETFSAEVENLNHTEKLVNEIRNLERLRKSRLFID